MRATCHPPGEEDRFCWSRYLNKSVLRMMSDMRSQFVTILTDAGFVQTGDGTSGGGRFGFDGAEDRRAGCIPLVRAVTLAGLYPKVAAVKNGKRKVILIY